MSEEEDLRDWERRFLKRRRMFEEAQSDEFAQWLEVPVNRWDYEMTATYFNPTALSVSEQHLIVEAIGKAIRHTNRVVLRDHIKGDRLERVNQFITSLRREVMSQFNRVSAHMPESIVAYLCDKVVWHDVGVPAAHLTGDKRTRIQDWIMRAQAQSVCRSDAQAELILGDLEELERGLQTVQQQIEQAVRINEEGDRLSQQLCEVFMK